MAEKKDKFITKGACFDAGYLHDLFCSNRLLVAI